MYEGHALKGVIRMFFFCEGACVLAVAVVDKRREYAGPKVLPMSPERTLKNWSGREDLNLRPLVPIQEQVEIHV